MENTEKRYKRGLYRVATPKDVLEATKDDWDLVEVLQSDGRPPSFLLRGERDTETALQKARSETETLEAQYKSHLRRCEEHVRERTEAFKHATADKETAESRANSAVEGERLARERELDLRGKMVAQEEALNLYRQEVGRARQAEIEKEAVEFGELVLAPLKGRRSSDVLRLILVGLEELDIAETVYCQGRPLKLPELLSAIHKTVEEDLGW